MSKYVATPETKSESDNRYNFLDVGIHDDVELKSIEIKVSPNGNNYCVFHFEKDGKTFDHTEWEPKGNDDEVIRSKTENQITRFKHIITKFVPNEKYNIIGENFVDFVKKNIQLLGNSHIGKKVRIKVVFNNSGFTTLPAYVPFIESMEVPKNESSLYISSIDKMTREPRNINPAQVETSSSDNPFDKQGDDEEPKTDNSTVADDKAPF